MNCLIPLAIGHSIHPEVYKGLAIQSVETIIYPVTSPLKTGDWSGCCDNLNVLNAYISHPYVLKIDNRVVFERPDDLQYAIDYLHAHPELDGVVYDTLGKSNDKLSMHALYNHVDCACIIMNGKAAAKVKHSDVDKEGRKRCTCISYNEQLKIAYIPDRKIHEVKK